MYNAQKIYWKQKNILETKNIKIFFFMVAWIQKNKKVLVSDTLWKYTSPDGYRKHEGVTMLTEISEDEMFSF